MSNESGPTPPKSEISPSAADLKENLLDGSLDPGEFITKLTALDQSTPMRGHSLENVQILMSPEVAVVFENDPEHKFAYLNLLSLSYFHQGQIEAISAKDYGAALTSFKHAMEAANPIEEDHFQFWKDYVTGTVAYFEKDISTLKHICEITTEGRNRDILNNFLAQLEAGDEIDYRAAYSKM